MYIKIIQIIYTGICNFNQQKYVRKKYHGATTENYVFQILYSM